MYCNSVIHNEFKSTGEFTCPFCDIILKEVDKVIESCCDEEDMVNSNGMSVCINCGSCNGYVYVPEYIDFYTNLYRIRRKSVYNRKYHIENVLNDISIKNDLKLTYCQRNKIYKVFSEINNIIHKVNNGHKRMISIKFIIEKLCKMLGIPYKNDQITKSKKTLKHYKQYWEKVLLLIGDKIQSIVDS